MGWFSRLFHRHKLDAQLDSELRFHIEQQTADYVAAGMTADEARHRALMQFGGLEHIKEETRYARGTQLVEALVQDARYGLRQLRRNPGFAIAVVLTLAFGIGANSAIFSVIDGVFLRPLPYPQANRLVYPLWIGNGESVDAVGSADYLFWKEHTAAFESAGAYESSSGSNLVVAGQARFIYVTQVTPGLFNTLGVNPTYGRVFAQEEGLPNGPQAIILSYGLWQSAFSGNRNVVGRTVQMNGQSYAVTGVMPRDFEFVAAADAYTPLRLTFVPEDHDQNYHMVARLRPGETVKQAQVEVAQVFDEFNQMYPEAVWKEWRGLRLISYHEELAGDVEAPLLVLFGAVFMVLLIAIANVTSLFLGRAASRGPEIVLRAALGASRGRLRRQLLTEGILLACVGGALSLVFAVWGLRWLVAFVPHSVSIDLNTSLLPLAGHVKLNGAVLAFTLVVSVVAGIAAGFFPYMHVRKLNLYEELKQRSGRTDSSIGRPRTRNVLVTAEVATSVVLLVGAGLLAKSFLNLRTVNPGFNPRHLWAVEVSLPPQRYTTTSQVWALQKRVTQQIEAIPSVTGVASTSNLPVQRGLNAPVEIPGCGRSSVQLRAISSNYFRVMQIPLLTGREFIDSDHNGVAIINNELARRCWSRSGAIDARVGKSQVIGVVGDTKEGSVDNPALPVLYVPQWSVSDKFTQVVHGWFLSAWVIRSKTPLDVRTISQAINSVDPTLPVARFEPMTTFIANSFALSESRFLAVLVGGFTTLALSLAAIGIYGILSYLVARRAHEIGVRMALGAQRADVLRMVIGEGLRLALIGLAIGIAGAFGLTRLLSSLLFDVKPADPATFVAVALLLTGVAVAACYIPARRAMRVDPMVALRYD